eukprot:370341-Pleurochrysis_carterae.AAC.3
MFAPSCIRSDDAEFEEYLRVMSEVRHECWPRVSQSILEQIPWKGSVCPDCALKMGEACLGRF